MKLDLALVPSAESRSILHHQHHPGLLHMYYPVHVRFAFLNEALLFFFFLHLVLLLYLKDCDAASSLWVIYDIMLSAQVLSQRS